MYCPSSENKGADHLVSHMQIVWFLMLWLISTDVSQGDQKKRYKDTLNASLKDFYIPVGSLEHTAQERSIGEVSSTKEQLSMKKENI